MYTDLIQLEGELDEFLHEFGYQVVDLQHGGTKGTRQFRLFIDRVDAQPVTIDDCSEVAPQVVMFLEMKQLYNDNSSLEVSSAGLDRVLKRDRDFEKFLGSEIKVSVHEGSARKSFICELVSFNDEVLVVTTSEKLDRDAEYIQSLNGDGPTMSASIDRSRLDRVSLVPKVEF